MGDAFGNNNHDFI